jgi:hypothetical protein
MNTNPTVDRQTNSGVPIIWLWAIVGGAFVLLLSWLFRFPWG